MRLYAATVLLFYPMLLAGDGRVSFDSNTLETVMAPMRDGVRLATDVYRPARGGKAVEGKFPVLIERTPYNKVGRRKLGEFLARLGYVVVLQDSRGRFGSEGLFHPFLEEGKDGYDAIDWAAAQAWSDGRVGSFGGSYTGMDQYHAAMYRPPHLVGMFVQMAGSSIYESVAYPGGAPASDWLLWILRSAATSPDASQHAQAAAAMEKVRADLRFWLFQPVDTRAPFFKAFPVYEQVYRDFYAHSSLDEYWKQRGYYTAGYYSEIKDVPMLFVTGWYDLFMQGTIDVYNALRSRQKTEKKLMVGPWPHGIGTTECGDAHFDGPRVTEDQAALVADWFDHLLRHSDFELVSPEPVEIYRMGGGDASRTSRGKLNVGGAWRTLSAWPPTASRPVRYYLHGSAVLDTAKPKTEAPSTYEFDPAHPVPTRGGRNNTLPGAPNCVQDQSLDGRPDLLYFQSESLRTPLDVTGRVRASLWIASAVSDADFTAKLIDVYPSGYAALIAEGELRARYRRGFDQAQALEPGKPYEITVDLGSTSTLFAAGHRLRVDISSSNFPKLMPLPDRARQTLYHDGARASYIEIPVMK